MTSMLIVVTYVLFMVYVLFNLDKLQRQKVIEADNFTPVTVQPLALPKSHVKDSHWFIKTFLRNRKKKG